MRPKDRRRHAAIQREHAKRHREQKIPRKEDLARAFLEAARRDVLAHRSVNIRKTESGLWRRLFDGTVDVLVERTFDRQASTLRLVRVLLPASADPALPIADNAEGLLPGE
jgi:hypothetical protein